MKNNDTKVHEWYLFNVTPRDLDTKVVATLQYLRRFDPPEDGEWTVWAHELVSGAHGSKTVRIFLDEVLNNGSPVIALVEEFASENYQDEIMALYDEVSNLVAHNYNRFTHLPGKFYVGHNEADGSLGVFYSVKE